MAKKGSKKGNKDMTAPVAESVEKVTRVEEKVEETVEEPTEAKCCGAYSCHKSNRICRMKRRPLCCFFMCLLFAIGFIFFLIIRDDPTVTFDLCKTDAEKCVKTIIKAVSPYANPYAIISFLREKGYVN